MTRNADGHALKQECLRIDPLPYSIVNAIYLAHIDFEPKAASVIDFNNNIKRLCLSHERLRAELEQWKALANSQPVPKCANCDSELPMFCERCQGDI